MAVPLRSARSLFADAPRVREDGSEGAFRERRFVPHFPQSATCQESRAALAVAWDCPGKSDCSECNSAGYDHHTQYLRRGTSRASVPLPSRQKHSAEGDRERDKAHDEPDGAHRFGVNRSYASMGTARSTPCRGKGIAPRKGYTLADQPISLPRR